MPKRHVVTVRWRKFSRDWAIAGPGGPSLSFPTKREAVEAAREEARRSVAAGVPAQVRVYGKSGRIQTEWTYGRDPRRSKG